MDYATPCCRSLGDDGDAEQFTDEEEGAVDNPDGGTEDYDFETSESEGWDG